MRLIILVIDARFEPRPFAHGACRHAYRCLKKTMPKIMGLLMLIYQLVKRRANMQHYLMHKDLSTDPCTFKFRTWQK